MNTSNTAIETAIVAFHIGRGGNFHNQGHLTFLGENEIWRYVDELFISFENADTVAREIGDRANLKAKYYQAIEEDEAAISFLDRIGLPLGERVYIDGSGHEVGLSVAESESGVGRIDIDGQYNTTYAKRLADCSEKELRLIAETPDYVHDEVRAYAKAQLGLEE